MPNSPAPSGLRPTYRRRLRASRRRAAMSTLPSTVDTDASTHSAPTSARDVCTQPLHLDFRTEMFVALRLHDRAIHEAMGESPPARANRSRSSSMRHRQLTPDPRPALLLRSSESADARPELIGTDDARCRSVVTMRFAFYGRVSTEDQQDPEASRELAARTAAASSSSRSAARSSSEFFDIGQSRSLPWKRRPEAARLLEALADPARGFDAVVIGEPQRAFYGNQFGLTFPVFVHYGVAALGSRGRRRRSIPESEAHELVMTHLRRHEQRRTRPHQDPRPVRDGKPKPRSRDGSSAAARPTDTDSPTPAHTRTRARPPTATGCTDSRSTRSTAPVVRRIFNEYIARARPVRDRRRPHPRRHPLPQRARPGTESPSALSQQRTRGDKTAVRAILGNPRYTGCEVWNRATPRRSPPRHRRRRTRATQPRCAGTTARLDLLGAARARADHRPRGLRPFPRTRRDAANRPRHRASARRRGRTCSEGSCTAAPAADACRPSGTTAAPYYRCRYPAEYALTSEVDHPKTDLRPTGRASSTTLDQLALNRLRPRAPRRDLRAPRRGQRRRPADGATSARSAPPRSSRSATSGSTSTARPSTRGAGPGRRRQMDRRRPARTQRRQNVSSHRERPTDRTPTRSGA